MTKVRPCMRCTTFGMDVHILRVTETSSSMGITNWCQESKTIYRNATQSRKAGKYGKTGHSGELKRRPLEFCCLKGNQFLGILKRKNLRLVKSCNHCFIWAFAKPLFCNLHNFEEMRFHIYRQMFWWRIKSTGSIEKPFSLVKSILR